MYNQPDIKSFCIITKLHSMTSYIIFDAVLKEQTFKFNEMQ